MEYVGPTEPQQIQFRFFNRITNISSTAFEFSEADINKKKTFDLIKVYIQKQDVYLQQTR